MSKSWRSSNASAAADAPPCRLPWRPSRLVLAALGTLAVLAPLSVLASDLPRAWAWPLALAAGAWGLRETRRYRRARALAFVLPARTGSPTCDGAAIRALRVRWRGPLACLSWRGADGATQRRLFWPDTLPVAARRELRVAMMQREAAPGRGSVAG